MFAIYYYLYICLTLLYILFIYLTYFNKNLLKRTSENNNIDKGFLGYLIQFIIENFGPEIKKKSQFFNILSFQADIILSFYFCVYVLVFLRIFKNMF